MAAYGAIARARRYIDGIALELSIQDISAYCDAYGCDMPRSLFDACIFALDDAVLQKCHDERTRERK